MVVSGYENMKKRMCEFTGYWMIICFLSRNDLKSSAIFLQQFDLRLFFSAQKVYTISIEWYCLSFPCEIISEDEQLLWLVLSGCCDYDVDYFP